MREKEVALEVRGVMENVTEVHLGKGISRNKIPLSYSYPQGQNLRGFFGYEFLRANSKVSKTFLAGNPNYLYFKDARPLHGDGGELLPVIVDGRFINYRCSSCGAVLRYPARKGIFTSVKLDRATGRVTAFIRREGIVGRNKFLFRVYLNLKRAPEFAEDLLGAVLKAREEGIRLGARKGRGKGLFTLSDFQIGVITLEDIRRRADELESQEVHTFHFLSDVVAPEGLPETIVRSIKNAGKFLHPEYVSYSDPYFKVVSKKVLPPRTVVFLDRKEDRDGYGKNRLSKVSVIPRGAEITLKFSSAPRMFYECMAVAEKVMGAGKRTGFGKGEFRVL